jgi:hypothetical protein
VDLALVAATQRVNASQLIRALRVGAAHRGLTLPVAFAVPDLDLWRTGYPARAREAPGTVPDFQAAVRLVARFLDPALAGTATGSWHPASASWR